MKCPRCDETIVVTWGRYFKAPSGRFTCPACEAGLKGRHKWFYWPLLLVGCCVMGAPMAMLGHLYFKIPGAVSGWLIGAVVVGLPFDKYLENRIGVLAPDKHTEPHGEAGEDPEKPGTHSDDD